MSIDPRRAHLDVRRPIELDVASSDPARLQLGGPGPAGGGVTIDVRPGHHLYVVGARA